jgi:hypothetical protein
MKIWPNILRVALWSLVLLLVLSFGPILVELVKVPLLELVKVPLLIVFGWVPFLGRTLPRMEWNGSGIGLVAICMSILFLGSHWFLAGWMKHASQGRRDWKWKWTFVIVSALWLLFGISMGITGAAHQAAWLLTSKEPWVVSKRSRRVAEMIQMRNAALALRIKADDVGWVRDQSLQSIQACGRSSPVAKEKGLLLERLCIRPVENPEGGLAAILVYPRDPTSFSTVGMQVITPNSVEHEPASKLNSLLSKYSQSEKTAQ